MNTKPIKLVKPYERDFTLAVEEFWARGFLDELIPRLGLTSAYPVFGLFYVTEENMQIWENEEALDWFKDRLLERNLKGTAFIEPYIEEYKSLLAEIEGFWHRGPTEDKALIAKYVTLIRKGAPLFSMWYYPGTDERTPEDVMSLILEVRRTDEFFAANDTFIKGCIERLGGSPVLANFVYSDEFPDIPSDDVLRTRAGGLVGIDGRERIVMPLTEFAKKHPEYEFVGLFDATADATEVKGQVGQSGTAQGAVRIVKNKRQMSRVQEGDIIVSPMTTPDFLPAMKRAAAFVTDEGGIMCHAAIVARELKKPCVTGTKIATKIFKDGQIVEVDGSSGIVRVVSQA